jgi:hypothetical protein
LTRNSKKPPLAREHDDVDLKVSVTASTGMQARHAMPPFQL